MPAVEPSGSAEAPRLAVEEVLGSGAVGTVYRLRDGATGRVFAGKVPHASTLLDPAARTRLEQEARLAASIDDPHVVRVFGLVEHEGAPMLVMEWVEGASLAEVLAREGSFSWRRAIRIATGIARGLAAAHRTGVLHRDLKPANVLLTRGGDVKIADFGLARGVSIEGGGPGTVAGTPEYMAPESLDPLAIDPRSDLYALGCVLFEMLTGRPPYSGPTAHAVLAAHRSAPVPDPGNVPEPVAAVVRRLLAKVPEARPATAEACVRILEAAAAGRTAAIAASAGDGVGACARCGGDVPAAVGVCFACGLALPGAEAGRANVLVVGPGEPGDKLDTELRDRLVGWIRENPLLPVRVGPLAKKVPRVPFVLLRGISTDDAAAWRASLEALGLEAEILDRHGVLHRGLRRNMMRVGGRATLVWLSFGQVFAWSDVGAVAGSLFAAGAMAVAGAMVSTLRPRLRAAPVASVPAARAGARLAEVARAARGLRSVRYRRALAILTDRIVARARSGSTVEVDDGAWVSMLETACTGIARLDALDAAIAETPRGVADPSVRGLLRERDLWSARMLALLAALDEATADGTVGGSEDAHVAATVDLDDLRHRIEALEEVQGLPPAPVGEGGGGGT
ncbi:MAG: serine/threonine protein kinase [Deltaproteobacteria bacterium]|nr:MAG: serine/threonine protein kinase [Deltaproteobacteria bacterium]